MGNPIEEPVGIRLATGDEPQRPKFDPFTGKPLDGEPEEQPGRTFWEQQKAKAEPIHVAPTIPPDVAVNPYAPSGWQRKKREEFDLTVPSGQLARVMRLEREDLFRMNLMQYLDTFTPMLMEDTVSSDERGRRIREKMSEQPDSIASMFMAIDEVVMAATVRPRVTNDEKLVDYGGPEDWKNPNFIATAYINDVSMDDRFAIFAAAFGRSMDDLKSVLEQTPSVAGVAGQSSIQQDS
jgi:hypothetical protein